MPDRMRLLHLLDEAVSAPRADRSGRLEELLGQIATAEAADAAFCFEEFEPEDTIRFFHRLPPSTAAEILVEMTDEYLTELVPLLPIARLQQIVDSLPPDDAADLYNHLPQSHRIGILETIDKDLALAIRKLSEYEEQTAGSIMTTRFVAVPKSESVKDVLEGVREADKVETDRVYVVDEQSRLQGVLSLQDLLHVPDTHRPVADVMEDQTISVHEDDDQEEVVRVASTYGLSTVPIVDDSQRLVGIVTADDIDYVQEEEVSEDIFRMAGTVARHPTKLPVPRRILNRLPTILATVLIGLVTAQILGVLIPEDGEAGPSPILHAMSYVLIVIAVAGNVGTIANTIVVRGLATGELERGRLGQPFLGELLVGLGLGCLCAGMTFGAIALIEGGWSQVGSVVALALMIAVTFSAVAGFVIPLACAHIGIDPALAGPLVIALNDLAGTAVYVMICLVLLAT